jgi:D-alanyl-lipoteichoic acid acyltransferase DltB (MBOAT superfamily)
MLFNSFSFIIFLPVIFILYWFVAYKNLKLQNILIVIASYIFYGWWDWRFLFLILFSTIIDYTLGIVLQKQKTKRVRRLYLFTSIFINLLFLGTFKYYNFFIDTFTNIFSFFGIEIHVSHLNIILPVGISFYTFQTMSYTIDVYNRKLEPTKDIVAFTAFVSFFPQLVAGPIERATNFLPQFLNKRQFEYQKAIVGSKQILWGFFKKIVIADNCAIYANMIFNHSDNYSGAILILGVLFFAFQIYGDFSGYSDIAIGIAQLFGFELMQNFAFPYFSRNVAEFWRRWHISLSTWFRDYVYIPMGGSRSGICISIRNTFVLFILSGFWHGANWSFIIWGLINAIYFLPLLITNRNRKYTDIIAKGKILATIKESFLMLSTFSLTTFAWIFFRAQNTTHAFRYIAGIFSMPFFSLSSFQIKKRVIITSIMIITLLVLEWIGRDGKYALEKIALPKIIQWILYYILLGLVILFSGTPQTFIYFQF